MKIDGKKFFLLILTSILFLGSVVFVRAQTCASQEDCSNLIQQYSDQITKLQGQANTLKNQIAQFDAQIKLTTLKIIQTQDQITLLGGRIDQLGDSLTSLTAAFSSRAVETYKLSRFENNFIFILSATDISDAASRLHYLQKIQEEDRSLLDKLQTAQTTYQGQKTDQEALQKQLKIQQANLNAQKAAKNNLLIATKNDETRYQSLLSQAQAALRSLANYAESVGISLIPHQDLSDGWGKYLNQRDQNWGNVVINNSYDCGTDNNGNKIACTIARVGCLITSYAMVVSHFGGSINPNDIATNPSYFYSSTAFFDSPGPSANGHPAESLDNPSTQQLRDALNSGKAVVAGMSMNGGPYPKHYSDHWVVLRSVDGDSFKINDPEYPGAMDVSLKDHYGSWTIIQARIYN
ncbi:MAG: C39 family peptidase [Candidatus Woesebacteria bacterium]|nr:C39 family peptidase [Candidatus Woesebacteria bacterium]